VQIDRTRPTAETYTIRDATTGATVSSPRCAAQAYCTWQEEAQNFANWYAYYRNRMFSSIAVMAEAMSSMQEDKYQNLRIGYGRINYFAGATNPWNTASTFTAIADIDGVANPGALIRGVRPFIVKSPDRQQFFDWLFSLAWSGATPNREALDSAGRYFTRDDDKGPWGAVPGTANKAAHIPCRRNFTLLATDGEWTNASVGQPLINPTGPLTGPGSPTASDSVDGPKMTSGINNSEFTYKPADFPQFTGGSNSQDLTLTDVAVYYWNRDLRDGSITGLPNVVKPITTVGKQNEAFWQSMSTYIVGFGLFASMDTTTIRSAIAAGTSVTWPTVEGVGSSTYNSTNAANRVNDSFRAAMASRGQFYTATTVESLSNAVKSTFEDLTDQSGSGGGVALPGSVINGTDLFFRPSYFVGKDTYGKLEAFKVSTLGSGTEPFVWNASLPADRTVLTSTAATSATTFAAANLTSAQQTQIGGGDASKAGAVVSYLSGSTAQEIANGGTFRNRVSPFGTFVNSKPLYSMAPDFGYAGLQTIGGSYKTFVDNNKAKRTAAVYIGGNAGMFHAFRADTGVELFSYVPRGVYENLYALTQPGASHRYYVDGPVVQGDAYLGGSWKNIIVGTTGAGGASIFALDVTEPSNMDATKVLFDVTKADNPTGWSQYLGHVLGTGVIGSIKTSTGYEWVYMVGNGVESTSNQAALLVISLSNPGSVTAIPVGPTWVSTAADAEAKRNGMGGINVVYGPQRSIVAVYGGDKQGNLWRFNFAGGIPTQAAGFSDANAALFTATDSSTKPQPQPITTAPVLYPLSGGRMVAVFGTGKLYDNDDPTNTSSQALYAVIYDPTSGLSSISKKELNTVTVTAGAFDTAFDDKRGWVLELQAGERVIANPAIANALISITTYTPGATTNVCLGGGSSRLVRINVLSSSGLIENLTAATAGSPSLHFTPREYNPTDVAPPRACNQKDGCTGGSGSTSGSAQCHSTVLGVDSSTGQNTASCPQTPVLRVWRPLGR
jgi:type IV pilus assembly protein PilY1